MLVDRFHTAPCLKATTVKLPILALSLLVGSGSAAIAAETVSYADLVKAGAGDATSAKGTFGKSVEIAIIAKGELGYFAKASDDTTFVCSTGDKALTANKSAKGLIRATVVKAQGWDATTIYHLKDCQFAKPSANPDLGQVVTVSTSATKTGATSSKFDLDACAKAGNYSTPIMSECSEKRHAAQMRAVVGARTPSAVWKKASYKTCEKKLIAEGGGGSSLFLDVQSCAQDAELAYAKSK